MPVKGLKGNAIKTSVELLNGRLADIVALRLGTKQAHWNVKGANFIAVHELLDQVADRLADAEDTIAERVQQLDGVARGTVEVVAKETGVKPYPTDLTSSRDHIMALTERMADVGARMRSAISEAAEAGDEATVDIFVQATRQMDKDLWFLESHLKG